MHKLAQSALLFPNVLATMPCRPCSSQGVTWSRSITTAIVGLLLLYLVSHRSTSTARSGSIKQVNHERCRDIAPDDVGFVT